MDVFEALGDANRRRIVELVIDGEQPAGRIATHFEISRPAISQHLGVLVDAGVLNARREGRMRFYSVNPDALHEAGNWLEEQRGRWARALDALERAMEEGES